MGSGVRVPIRLDPKTRLRGGIKGIGGMSFFPGAIVALRGRNGGGGFFLAEELLSVRCYPSIREVIQGQLYVILVAPDQNAFSTSERCQRFLFHVYRMRPVQCGCGLGIYTLGRFT